MNRIDMDHAATTSLLPEALQAMLPLYEKIYGNPSSMHETGREARHELEEARKTIAQCLGALPEEIYFTSGGTESDNWAIQGAAWANIQKGKHIITTAIEHHAVLYTCEFLEKQGFEVTYLPVDAQGIISLDDLKAAIREDTILISIMAANNEIGTLQPVCEAAAIAREKGILFHTDAVQVVGAMPVSVEDWGVDMLSLSGHKFHGPKGIGALYIRKGCRVDAYLRGGAQERGRRASTENVPAAVGMATALRVACENLEDNAINTMMMRDSLVKGICYAVPDARLNGHAYMRLPGNANFLIPGVDAETLLLRMDMEGVACSVGSACTAGAPEPSHVLLALGLTDAEAKQSIRFTLGADNTSDEVAKVIEIMTEQIKAIRAVAKS